MILGKNPEDWTIEELKSDEVLDAFEDILHQEEVNRNLDYLDLKDILLYFYNLVERFPELSREQPYDRYYRSWRVRLFILLFPAFALQDIVSFIKTETVFALREGIDLLEAIKLFLVNSSDDILGYKMRIAILNALEYNTERIGSRDILFSPGQTRVVPTIQNWIRDLNNFSAKGLDIATVEYINTSPNVSSLSSLDRGFLKKLFEMYTYLNTEFVDPMTNRLGPIRKKLAQSPSYPAPFSQKSQSALPSQFLPSRPVAAPKPVLPQRTSLEKTISSNIIPPSDTPFAPTWKNLESEVQKSGGSAGFHAPSLSPASKPFSAPEIPQRPVPPKPFAGRPAVSVFPQIQRIPGKTLIQDVKAPPVVAPRVEGPLEEIARLDLQEFRRLGGGREAAEKILEKINLLAEESLSKKGEGMKRFRTSPLNKLYLHIAGQAIETGKSIAEVLKSTGDLTEEEFDAIADLNRHLRF